VPEEELGDVGRHAVHDRVGGEYPAEVVGWKLSGLPSVPVMPEGASAPRTRLRMPPAAIGWLSRPLSRWNSRGIDGFQARSWMS
jgi:hypothetical protein